MSTRPTAQDGSSRGSDRVGRQRHRRRWNTRQDLRLAIVTWIEKTYRRRRQQALERLTPIEYETLLPAAHAA